MQTHDEPLLTNDEAAEVLRMRPDSLRKLVQRKLVPHVRYPSPKGKGSVRFRRSELLEWVERYAVPVRSWGENAIRKLRLNR